MNIFCDYHHAGLARSMYYLFGKRLYHRICFPNVEFGDQVDPNHIWGRVTDEIFLKEMGGINANCWKENAGFISKEELPEELIARARRLEAERRPVMGGPAAIKISAENLYIYLGGTLYKLKVSDLDVEGALEIEQPGAAAQDAERRRLKRERRERGEQGGEAPEKQRKKKDEDDFGF